MHTEYSRELRYASVVHNTYSIILMPFFEQYNKTLTMIPSIDDES